MGEDARVSRRRLISASARGAAALTLGPGLLGPGVAAAASPGRVIVVGAGLAGLTSAFELERAGWEVRVLEARPRLGGRVFTVGDFAGGQHAEAGGEYVDTHHTYLRGYCKRFGLPLEDTGRGFGGLENAVYRNSVRWLARNYRDLATRRRISAFYRALYDIALPLDPAAPARVGGAAMDRRSLGDFLDTHRIHGHARFLLDRGFRDDYGLDPEGLSLLFVALSERIGWDQPDGGVEAYRVRGGNSRLVDAFAARLNAAALTDAAVDRIAHGGSGVSVHTTDGRIFDGDACVVAAPLPAVRGITFTPGLSAPLARAVAELGNAPVAKVLLQYRQRFWRERGFSGDLASDLPIGSSWEATDQQPGARGVLLTYAAGRRGKAMAGHDEAGRIAIARRDLERVYPGSSPMLIKGHSVAWAAEPYSGGAWAAYRPGQVLALWPQLHEQEPGPLQFAGEHTERLTGYMEGAIRSGVHAAKRLDAG